MNDANTNTGPTENKRLDGGMAARSCNHDVVELPIDDLQPHPCNARRHSKKQIKQIDACFGFIVPALIDANKTIIAGTAVWQLRNAWG